MTDHTSERDQFAMAALRVAAEWFGFKPENARQMAAMSYHIADAMIEARALSPRKGGSDE